MTDQEKIDIIKEFVGYCQEELDIEHLPSISITTDRDWVIEKRSFGQYNPSEKNLLVYIKNRNLADVLRTLGHELVHHRQHELGMIKGMDAGKSGSPIENQANAIAGILMRNFGKTHDVIYESYLPTLKQIYEVKETGIPQIYCDMDGVLCDFDSRFEYYFDISPQKYYRDRGIKAFEEAVDSAGIDFWSKMPWQPGGIKLWSIIGKYSPIILTSPATFQFAKQGKLLWIKNNLIPQPKNVIFAQTGKKHLAIESELFNTKKVILIDDWLSNIEPWESLGGIGIIHKDVNKTKDILSKLRIK